MTSIHEIAASPLKSNLYELKMNLKKKKLLLSFLMKYVRKLKAVLDLKIFSDLFWRKCYRQSMPHLSEKLNWKSCFLFYPCSPFKLTFASISIFIISLFLPQNICIKIPRKKANRYFDAVHFIWFLTFFGFSFFFFFWFYFLFNYFFWSVLGKNEPVSEFVEIEKLNNSLDRLAQVLFFSFFHFTIFHRNKWSNLLFIWLHFYRIQFVSFLSISFLRH